MDNDDATRICMSHEPGYRAGQCWYCGQRATRFVGDEAICEDCAEAAAMAMQQDDETEAERG